MQGFEFFNEYNTNSALRSQLVSEELFILSTLRQIVSTGASLMHIVEHRDKYDLAFISAFRTVENPDERGYKYIREGVKNNKGNTRQEGKEISKKENKRREIGLARAIRDLGYGFIQIEGNNGASKDTYVVVNTVEDTEVFATRMLALGRDFQQDSVLIAPKQDIPYFYYFDGRKEFAKDASIEELENSVSEYFSQIKGKKFSLAFGKVQVCVVSGFPGNRDSLSPIRQGYEALIPLGARKDIDNAYSDLQKIIDSRVGKVRSGLRTNADMIDAIYSGISPRQG